MRVKRSKLNFSNSVDADEFEMPKWVRDELSRKQFDLLKGKGEAFKVVASTESGVKILKGRILNGFAVWAEMENTKWSVCSGKLLFSELGMMEAV